MGCRSGWPSARARARSPACGVLDACTTPRRELRHVLLSVVAAALLLVGGLILGRALVVLGRDRARARRPRARPPPQGRGGRARRVVGFVLGMTSAGSGALIAIGLIIGLPADPAPRRRHRRLPRRDDAVGRRHRARGRGNIDFAPDGHHPHRLAARRLDRRPPGRPRARSAGCARRSGSCCSRRLSARRARPASTCRAWAHHRRAPRARRTLRRRVRRSARRKARARRRGGSLTAHELQPHPPAGPRGRGDPHHARGRRRARAPVLLFSGGKDSIVLLRLAEKAFRPGPLPVPADARRHRAQLPRGHRVPRPPRRRARRAADRRLGAGLDRRRPRGRGDRPARARATGCRP